MPLPFECPSHFPPPSHTSRLGMAVKREPQFEFSDSYKFPLDIYFIYGSVYVSMLFSPFIPHSLSSTHPYVHKSVLYVHISIAALQQVHEYHLSRFNTYALICDVCFALSDLLHLYNSPRFIHLIRTESKCIPFMAR